MVFPTSWRSAIRGLMPQADLDAYCAVVSFVFLAFPLPSASYALWTFAVVVAMFFLIALVTWQDAKIQLVLALCSFSVWKVWEAPKRIKNVEYGRILEGCDFLLLEHFFSQASGLSESPFEKKFFFHLPGEKGFGEWWCTCTLENNASFRCLETGQVFCWGLAVGSFWLNIFWLVVWNIFYFSIYWE